MSPAAPRPVTSWVRMSFTSCSCSACGGGVGQQGHLARVLHRDGHVPLVLDAVPGDPARADLAAVGDELPEQRGVLVVDVGRLVLAELANLLLRLAQNRLRHCGAPSSSPDPADVGSGMVDGDLGSGQNGGSSDAGAALAAHGALWLPCWAPCWAPCWPPQLPWPAAWPPWLCWPLAHRSRAGVVEKLLLPPPPDRVVLVTLAVAYFRLGPTSSTSISNTVRFSPSRVSYERALRRPETITRMPRVSDSAAFSAACRQTEQLRNRVSWSFHSLVCRSSARGVEATVKFATAAPEGGKRSSGSAVRLPTTVIGVSPAMSGLQSVEAQRMSGRMTLVRSTDSLRES